VSEQKFMQIIVLVLFPGKSTPGLDHVSTGLPNTQMEQIKYCKHLTWAATLTPDPPENCRLNVKKLPKT